MTDTYIFECEGIYTEENILLEIMNCIAAEESARKSHYICTISPIRGFQITNFECLGYINENDAKHEDAVSRPCI